jgi:hypothetical protein
MGENGTIFSSLDSVNGSPHFRIHPIQRIFVFAIPRGWAKRVARL